MSHPDFLVGLHSVEGALKHDAGNIVELLVEAGHDNRRLKALIDLARELGVEVHSRPREFLDKATGGMRHQGVIARYKRGEALLETDLERLLAEAGREALFLVLDGVQDPHNLGACLRSARAAAVTAVIVPKDRAVGITPVVRAASAGAADRVPLVRATNLVRTLDILKTAGVWVTGLVGEARDCLYAIDLSGPVALVVGGESDGLRRLTRDTCDHLAAIPMAGDVESLNVSVATGIALFEVRRQRAARAS